MLRILYMVLFYLIYSVSEIALLVIAVIQALLNLFSGEPSSTLRDFGQALGVYVKQIAEYLSYASDYKPFPFADWPSVEVIDVDLNAPPQHENK